MKPLAFNPASRPVISRKIEKNRKIGKLKKVIIERIASERNKLCHVYVVFVGKNPK
jgi:hypothetical protein